MTKRPGIPKDLERQVKIEAGHRCAIPTCRHPRVEIAHIIPWTEVKEHKFENLIALCPNCHNLYDKDKKIDRKSLKIYKSNLSTINGRYSHFEMRIFQYFIDNPEENQIKLWGRELDVLFLVRDGLLKELNNNFANAINFPPALYAITKEGRRFIQAWTQNEKIDLE